MDLAARIGGRRALYGNLTWTRPGLEEEEKARSHQGIIGFGKGHRLASQKSSWDRAPMGYDSEASSSNDEDMDTVQPDDTSDVFSSPRTPSKPRFMRNRTVSGTPHTPSGTLMERLGVALPPEDGAASVVTKSTSAFRTNSAASASNEKPAVSNIADEGARPATVASSDHSSSLELGLLPSPYFKPLDNAKPGDRPDESIPGLYISRARSERDAGPSRVEPVAKAPYPLNSGSSPELVDNMRRLLVPLVVKQARREGSSSNNEVHDLDLAQKAHPVITDNICEEFIRQAIASSDALKGTRAKDVPQSRTEDIEMSPPTTASTTAPPGLGEATQSVRSVVPTAAPRPTASRAEAFADSGKTVLPSHPLPTGPRSMQIETRVPSNLHDGREVLGAPSSSFAYPAKGKEREWDANRTSASQHRYLPSRQSPHSRRSRSPRSVSGYRRSRSRSGSRSRAGHRPPAPGWYEHDNRRPRDDHREFGYRSPPPVAARNDSRDMVRRPERQPSPAHLYYDHTDRRPTRRSPSPRDRRETMSTRHFSPSYDDRERTSAHRPSHSYDDQERRLARQISLPYDNRREKAVQQAPPPYDDRNNGPDPYPSPRYHSRYTGASSPRHSISSSREVMEARSLSRGRSPPPPHPQSTSLARVPKRKSYSPLAREGPPRGWSREPPARATPDGPFPKKSKHERDNGHQRLSYERPTVPSPIRSRKESSRDAGPSPGKYQHICHRPPGYRCDHASHNEDLARTQTFDGPPRSEASWDGPRRDPVAPAPRSATDSDFKNWVRLEGDTYAHANRRDAPPPPPHMTSAPNSSLEDAAMAPILPDPAASIATLIPTVDTKQSQRLGGSIERTVSLIPGLGMAPVMKVEQTDESPLRDSIEGFNPPGLLPAPALSSASTVLDLASGGMSSAPSSFRTLVNHTVTSPAQSSASLRGHLNGGDEDAKPDIKKLEEILANMKQEQQQVLALPSGLPPHFTQLGIPSAPSSPPYAVPGSGLIPTLTPPTLVNRSSSTTSSHHSIESSQIPTPPSALGPPYPPVPAKLEDVEAVWPVGGIQQIQGRTDSPATQTWSLPPVVHPLDQTVAILHQQQPVTNTGTGASYSTLPFPLPIFPGPHSSLAVGKTEPELAPNMLSSLSRDDIGTHLTVPGVWLVQQGADSVKTMDRTFHIGDRFAREWDIPMQSDSDDTDTGMEYGDVALTMKPSITLQLLCFETDKLVDWKGNPETILELQQKWPMIQDLIVVSNHGTPGQQVWMSHDLPKRSGAGRPILLERYVHSGPNTLRIIQLTDLSKFTFVLFAKPDVPPPEARQKSQSSTADKYDDYFAKLREGVAKPQSLGETSKPVAGSVTVQLIPSDEEL